MIRKFVILFIMCLSVIFSQDPNFSLSNNSFDLEEDFIDPILININPDYPDTDDYDVTYTIESSDWIY